MAGKAPYRPAGAGQKQSLHIRHEAPRKLFVQERVGDGLLLAGLPPAQKGATALIGEKDGPVLLLLEMLRRHDFLVDAGKHKTVGVNSAQLFHEVEGEAPAPGPARWRKPT